MIARRAKREAGKSPGALPAALAAAAGLALAAGAALAAESGSFELHESYAHDLATMRHADAEITAGSLRGTAAILKSSGGPFKEGAKFGAACLLYLKESAEGVRLEAPCALTDASGDRLWLLVEKHEGGVRDSRGRGVQRIAGGAGKYAGARGECSYRSETLPDGRAVVVQSTCSWRRP